MPFSKLSQITSAASGKRARLAKSGRSSTTQTVKPHLAPNSHTGIAMCPPPSTISRSCGRTGSRTTSPASVSSAVTRAKQRPLTSVTGVTAVRRRATEESSPLSPGRTVSSETARFSERAFKMS